MLLPYGQGAHGVAALLDANWQKFERFIHEGLDQEFYEYWEGVLVADELGLLKGKSRRG